MHDQGEPDVQKSPSSLRPYIPFLVVAALVALFFSPFLLEGKTFLAADTLYQFYPWRYFAGQDFRPHNTLITDPVNMGYAENYNAQLKEGELQMWSPRILGGLPSFLSPHTGGAGRYFALKLILHRLFDTHTATMLVICANLLMMGCFMYLYLSGIGAGMRGALFGSVVYMFNGCVMVWLSFETIAAVGAVLPLLMIVMERFLTSRRYLYAFGGSLMLGIIVITGHLQYTLYVGMFMLFYMAFILIRACRRGPALRETASILACFAITGLGGLLIGAIELIPWFEAISNSSRIARSFDFQGLFDTLGRVPFRHFVTLIYPDYFGSPPLHFNLIPKLPAHEYMNYNELCLYLGIPTLFAILALSIKPATSFARFYLLMTVLFASMIAGMYTFYPFFKLYPGMDKMNPLRLIFLFATAASVSAGLGLKALESFSKVQKRIFLAGSALIVLAAAFLAFFSDRREMILWFNRENSTLFMYTRSPFERLAQLRDIGSPIIYKPLLLTVLAFSLFALYALFQKRRGTVFVFAFLLALLSIDLMAFGRSYNKAHSPDLLYPEAPSIAFLKKLPGPYRVVQDTSSGLWVNSLSPFGIDELGGYAVMYPERVNKMVSFMEFGESAFSGRIFDRWVTFSRHTSPFYDLLNVKYLLTAPGKVLPSSRYRLVYRKDLAIYENTGALPRAFAVHDYVVKESAEDALRYMGSTAFDMRGEVVLEESPPSDFIGGISPPARPAEVRIVDYSPDSIEIDADMPANGWLVVSDTWYPGWEVSIDGRAAPIARADCSLRAVALTAGRHMVHFRYRPSSFALGRNLSILAFVLSLAGMAAFALFRKRERPGAAAQQV